MKLNMEEKEASDMFEPVGTRAADEDRIAFGRHGGVAGSG